MGTTPRSDDEGVIVANGFGKQPAAVGGVLVDLEKLTTQYANRLTHINPEHAVSQAAMRVALRLKAIEKAAKKAYEAFVAAALKHEGKSGPFQAGAVQIAFPISGKRSVAWKDEATTQASRSEALELAIDEVLDDARAEKVRDHAAGQKFDTDSYHKQVLDETTPSSKRGVALTESE